MTLFWRFRCDLSHPWEVVDESGAEEPLADWLLCPVDGTEAVTASRHLPADVVSVTLLSAAFVADEVTGRVARQEQFYLQVSSWDESHHLRSRSADSWDEMVRKAGAFRSCSWLDAVRRWDRMGLGRRGVE